MLFRNVKSGQKSSVACLRPRIFEMSTTEAPPYPDTGEDVVWGDILKETLLTTDWQGTGFKFPETYVSLYTDRTCLIINLRKKYYIYILIMYTVYSYSNLT